MQTKLVIQKPTLSEVSIESVNAVCLLGYHEVEHLLDGNSSIWLPSSQHRYGLARYKAHRALVGLTNYTNQMKSESLTRLTR